MSGRIKRTTKRGTREGRDHSEERKQLSRRKWEQSTTRVETDYEKNFESFADQRDNFIRAMEMDVYGSSTIPEKRLSPEVRGELEGIQADDLWQSNFEKPKLKGISEDRKDKQRRKVEKLRKRLAERRQQILGIDDKEFAEESMMPENPPVTDTPIEIGEDVKIELTPEERKKKSDGKREKLKEKMETKRKKVLLNEGTADAISPTSGGKKEKAQRKMAKMMEKMANRRNKFLENEGFAPIKKSPSPKKKAAGSFGAADDGLRAQREAYEQIKKQSDEWFMGRNDPKRKNERQTKRRSRLDKLREKMANLSQLENDGYNPFETNDDLLGAAPVDDQYGASGFSYSDVGGNFGMSDAEVRAQIAAYESLQKKNIEEFIGTEQAPAPNIETESEQKKSPEAPFEAIEYVKPDNTFKTDEEKRKEKALRKKEKMQKKMAERRNRILGDEVDFPVQTIEDALGAPPPEEPTEAIDKSLYAELAAFGLSDAEIKAQIAAYGDTQKSNIESLVPPVQEPEVIPEMKPKEKKSKGRKKLDKLKEKMAALAEIEEAGIFPLETGEGFSGEPFMDQSSAPSESSAYAELAAFGLSDAEIKAQIAAYESAQKSNIESIVPEIQEAMPPIIETESEQPSQTTSEVTPENSAYAELAAFGLSDAEIKAQIAAYEGAQKSNIESIVQPHEAMPSIMESLSEQPSQTTLSTDPTTDTTSVEIVPPPQIIQSGNPASIFRTDEEKKERARRKKEKMQKKMAERRNRILGEGTCDFSDMIGDFSVQTTEDVLGAPSIGESTGASGSSAYAELAAFGLSDAEIKAQIAAYEGAQRSNIESLLQPIQEEKIEEPPKMRKSKSRKKLDLLREQMDDALAGLKESGDFPLESGDGLGAPTIEDSAASGSNTYAELAGFGLSDAEIKAQIAAYESAQKSNIEEILGQSQALPSIIETESEPPSQATTSQATGSSVYTDFGADLGLSEEEMKQQIAAYEQAQKIEAESIVRQIQEAEALQGSGPQSQLPIGNDKLQEQMIKIDAMDKIMRKYEKEDTVQTRPKAIRERTKGGKCKNDILDVRRILEAFITSGAGYSADARSYDPSASEETRKDIDRYMAKLAERNQLGGGQTGKRCIVCKELEEDYKENPFCFPVNIDRTRIMGHCNTTESRSPMISNGEHSFYYRFALTQGLLFEMLDAPPATKWFDNLWIKTCGHMCHKYCISNEIGKTGSQVFVCQVCNESYKSLFPHNNLSEFISVDPYSRVPYLQENKPSIESVLQVFERARRIQVNPHLYHFTDVVSNMARTSLNYTFFVDLMRNNIEVYLMNKSPSVKELAGKVADRTNAQKHIPINILFKVCNNIVRSFSAEEAYQLIPSIDTTYDFESSRTRNLAAADFKQHMLTTLLFIDQLNSSFVRGVIMFYYNLFVLQLYCWLVACIPQRKLEKVMNRADVYETALGFMFHSLYTTFERVPPQWRNEYKNIKSSAIMKLIKEKTKDFLTFALSIYYCIFDENTDQIKELKNMTEMDLLVLLGVPKQDYVPDLLAFRCFFWPNELVSAYIDKFIFHFGYLLHMAGCNINFQHVKNPFILAKPLYLGSFNPPSFIPLTRMHQEFVDVYEGIASSNQYSEPIICLVCGETLCKTRFHKLEQHSEECGSGTSVFMDIYTSMVLIMKGLGSYVWKFLYIRKKSGQLDQRRLRKLQNSWLHNSFENLELEPY